MTTIKQYINADDEWPGGLSDGLILPCAGCGRNPVVDYLVSDVAWKRITLGYLGVICIDCFMGMGGKPEDVLSVQITGDGQTAVASVEKIFYYGNRS